MTDKIAPIHPGEILLTEFMEPYGLSARKLAEHLGVPANRISTIVAGKRSITAETAMMLGRFFNTSAQMWLGLQLDYDMDLVEDDAEFALALDKIEPMQAA